MINSSTTFRNDKKVYGRESEVGKANMLLSWYRVSGCQLGKYLDHSALEAGMQF